MGGTISGQGHTPDVGRREARASQQYMDTLRQQFGTERAALVVRPRAALMAGPSAGAAWLTTATAGDRLIVQGQQDTWYQVQWQGQEAYIRTHDLLLVK